MSRLSMRRKLAELAVPRDRDLRGQKKNRRSTGEPPFSLDSVEVGLFVFWLRIIVFGRLWAISFDLERGAKCLFCLLVVFRAMN